MALADPSPRAGDPFCLGNVTYWLPSNAGLPRCEARR
jgi:hypothetical protein